MTAAYNPTGDFRVAPGETLTAIDQGGIAMAGSFSSQSPSLTIAGTLDVRTTAAFDGSNVYAALGSSGTWDGAVFAIEATGVVTVTALGRDNFLTFGFDWSNISANFSNAGRLTVIGEGRTFGVHANTSAGTFTNSGELMVKSVSDFALGVDMADGAFRNSNLIEVHAHHMARGVSVDGFFADFQNSGSIIVTDDGSDWDSIAVEWKSSIYPNALGIFVNTGMLRGDKALVATTDVVDPRAVELFVNHGTMIGAVDLGDAPAQLVNTGLISGSISLGGSNDLYDGRSGTAAGPISGGAGDDTIIGGAGADVLRGDAGDDQIDGSLGANQLDGGAGSNTLSFKTSQSGATVDLAAGTSSTGDIQTFVNFQRVLGSDNADTVAGSAGADTIDAGSGADLVYATTGGDVLGGGAGDDMLSFVRMAAGVEARFASGSASGVSFVSGFEGALGSAFGDTLSGGGGVSSLFGGGGGDSILAADGGSFVRGEEGGDTIAGASGYDNVNGNQGDDSVDGGAGGDDWLLGGQGDDRIVAHAGNVILNGNLGADTVTGGVGHDIIRGGQGADILNGGSGDDLIFGDRGDDVVTGSAGADAFYFSEFGGADRILDFNGAAGDRIRLDAGARYTLDSVGSDTVVLLAGGDKLTIVGVSNLMANWIVVG